ncbi:hypothetical protein SUGI_1160000 [Cryptomeria japonica]|nr:hypothetical protein SUGI_1160000 [Cryptomeria japonica]
MIPACAGGGYSDKGHWRWRWLTSPGKAEQLNRTSKVRMKRPSKLAYPAPGSHHSPEKIFVPSLHCSASPRSCGRHLNFNEEPQTPEKLGSRCSSIFDDFNCMAATESASARACPRRQRPQTPETEGRSSVKRRLIFHAVETSSVASPTMPQRSPSLKGSSLIRGIPGPIMTERSNMSFTGTGSNKRDETKPSSVGDLRKWLR